MASTLLTITGIPSSGWVAGQAYNLTATVANNAFSGAGFNLSVSAGSISNAGAGAALVNPTEIRHNARKSMISGAASWTFTWTAPGSGSSVNFNFAGNAVNGNGTNNGDAPNQITLTYNVAVSTRPTATTNPANAITSTDATLSGTANAEGNSGVTASFEYGTTAALGSTVAATPASITGTTATAVTAALSALSPGTTYFYRLKLSSSLGTDTGTILSFSTTPSTPTAPAFGPASAIAITASNATISGSITPNSTNAMSFGLNYGTTTALGKYSSNKSGERLRKYVYRREREPDRTYAKHKILLFFHGFCRVCCCFRHC